MICGPSGMTEELQWENDRLKQRINELEQLEASHSPAEEALRRFEEKYRTPIENSRDMIYALRPPGVFTLVQELNRTWRMLIDFQTG